MTEYINRGEGYQNIKKIYSVNIVYFDLGQGKDHLYHGKTEFLGVNTGEVLNLSPFQRQKFKVDVVSELYPEYYILKVNDFKDNPRYINGDMSEFELCTEVAILIYSARGGIYG